MNAVELTQHYRAVRMRLMGPSVVNRVIINHQPAVVVDAPKPEPEPKPVIVPLPERTEFATRSEAIRYQVHKMIREEHMMWDEVFSTSRRRKFVKVRHRIWAWLRQCGLTTTQIALFSMPQSPKLRNKRFDHTTVVHGLKMFAKNPSHLPPPIICGTIRVHHSKKQMETPAPSQGA